MGKYLIHHEERSIKDLTPILYNKKLKESEVIVENAVKEKEAMERKLIVIQELWEKQKVRQETF